LAGISTANAVDALTSTVNGFAATGVTTTQILNKLVAVEQDYAVGAGDLAEALSRTGQAAQEAGVSLDQLNALVTAAQQSTARGGAVIGNALKTIFTRLQRTETLDQLEAFNISVRDVQGNILPAVQILQNFAGAYRGLADAQRAQLSEQVAGVYQVNILKAIVNDLNKSQGTYAGALQRGASATNEAEIATAKLNQTLDALLKQTATSTQQLANNIGKVTFEPLAKYGTEQLKSFVESMNEVLEGEGIGSTFANGLLKGIRNVIAGPGAIAAFFTLFKLIQNSFTYLSQALPQIAGITTETQNRKNIEQSILQIMQQQGPAAQALAGLMGNQAAQAQLLLQIARQQTAEYQMQTTLAKQLAVQLAGQGVKVKGSGGLQVTRAGGYIPNATKMAEVVGAQAGGYTPGRVVSSPVGGVMNTAEDVKYIPGFAQPFINPPAGSKAGRAHRQNAISRTGVDPYMFSGFIPNFVKGVDLGARGKEFEKLINFYLIKEKTTAGSDLLDFNLPSNALTEASLNDKNKISLNPLSVYGDAKIKSTKETKRDLVKKLVGSLDSNVYAKLITRANKIKSDTINLNDFLSDKPSLISSKSSITNDNLNASIEAQLGPDVIENLQRLLKNNKNTDRLTEDSWYKKLKLFFIDDYVTIPDFSNSGFIPNFATPMTTASIPWFKKYSSKYKNASGDTDLFKMGDFPTYGRGLDHEYAKKGNSAMLSYLHEDFVRSALNIALGSKKVIRPAEVGFKNKPVSDIANENDFDLLYRIADGSYSMLELKQDFKNVSGSVTGFMNKKLANLEKENPVLAKKVSSMIAVSNRPKFTDPTGRNPAGQFSEFEMAAASIVKDKYSNVDPSISAKLTKVTDGLLRRYEAKKNTTYGGFIPNFAYKQAVMGLEESMSGNKAIFDTKPFPHIRNSSQPTFSSAIADHGGLGNALSDSMRGQKAAGLMNRGFVPNFASKVRRRLARNKPSQQAASAATTATTSSASSVLSDDDISKAIENLITSIQNADEQMGLFESVFGGRTKLIDAELGKLKNALTAGGVSGAKLDSAMNKASKEINSQQSKFAKSLASAGTAISIAGPMIAGLVEQTVYGNKKRTEMTSGERSGQVLLSTGLSAVSTGAGIGAAFGPLGAGIGAAAGALVGLTSAINATTLSAEELSQLNQEQVQKSQASITAASSYIEAQKSLTQMIASGASSSDIEIATKKLSDNFNEIKDVKLQEIFNSTGGDVIAMTKQLQDYTNQVTKESAKQSGLYSKDLKSEERASALSLGLGKEGAKDFISKTRARIEEINKRTSGKTKGTRDYIRKEESQKLAETLVPTNEPERKSKIEALTENILNKDFEKVLEALEKNINLTETVKAAANFKQAATKSFNQIFLEIEQQIAKSAFEVSLNFEKDSGSRKIQSAILDFSMNFQDNLNSFLLNNLPDARKFDFTAATAGQKAQMLLQKSQQDYDKAIADQTNERANFLSKNSENLTKEFKSSFLQSQASAEFYQNNILPQIQQGVFSGNAQSLAKQFESASFTEAQAKVTKAGFSSFTLDKTSTTLEKINNQMSDLSLMNQTNTEDYQKLLAAQKALIDLQNQTALFQNQNEMKKLQTVLDTVAREQELFEIKQANAKKELEINKQLNEARIAVDREIAQEKARVDKENLMRMESMKDLSANIGNALEISKARSAANVNALQRRLDDQRETFGMGRSQISERKFGIQADILKEQRKAEDAAINAEIQQRVLEMAAEQENTAATLKLNDTIMTLIETQLRGEIGGQENINDIQGRVNEMGQYAQTDVDLKYGQGTFAKYQALQRIQESRVASAESNTGYNTSDFSSRMQAVGFNDKMTQAEQSKFLEQEETKAREAGNVVLAGTIKRYKDQIEAKKEALKITRKDVDEQIKLNAQIERVNNTFAGRFRKGWGNLRSEADDLILNLGENLPKMFADGMVDGIKAAIRESDNLGDALMGVASKFLDSISTTLMQASIYGLLGSIGVPNLPTAGKQKGGYIRAQSGMYISGTGSGDKYPALLENGEYVLNRNAVMAMGGPASLDKLNFSTAPRFAAGGTFSSNFEDISSMESNMTSFGLEESKLYNELRDQKRAEIEAARQKKRAQKQQMAGIIGSLAGAAVSLGISAGVNKFGNKPSTPQKIGDEYGQLALRTDFSGSPFRKQSGGLIGSRLSDTIPAYATGGLVDNPIVKRYAIGGASSGVGYGGAIGNSSTINNNTNASNSFNFNTTVQRDGKIEIGANSTSYAQQDVELSQNLNSKVYDVVLDTIRKEKRFGGSLAGIRN
jgi:TP901 family phage tail tape measure protein